MLGIDLRFHWKLSKLPSIRVFTDVFSQGKDGTASEGGFSIEHFKKDYAKTPNITLRAILKVIQELGRSVKRGTFQSHSNCLVHVPVKDFGKSEIPDL
jgi:hypothetical protein